jgi:hypothetical protein
MTLILGALTKSTIVVASDGFEFLHTPGKAKELLSTDCLKLFPIGQKLLLAIHGQTRFSVLGNPGKQEHVSDIILRSNIQLLPIATVRSVAQKLIEIFNPIILQTFTNFDSSVINPFGIVVFGFDLAGGSRPRAYEVYWFLPCEEHTPEVFDLSSDRKQSVIIHSGSGAKYSKKTIIESRWQKRLDELYLAPSHKVKDFIRELYETSRQKQSEFYEFGGNYKEVTMTSRGTIWTTPG